MFDRLNKPTPKKYRRLGNALLAVGSAFIPFEAYLEFPDIAIVISFAATILGKFLCELAVEE